MKNLKFVLLINLLLSGLIYAQESTFKLFEKSEKQSGFGAVTFNMYNGKYFMFGGEGAAVFNNFYFGGFGESGSLGNYTYPFGSIAYELKRSSGGIMLGGMSNGSQFFAVFTDLKLSWDSYQASSGDASLGLGTFQYRSFSFLPAIGLAIRPISWLQVRLGGGYRFSGLVDDGGLENVPYNGANINFQLTFGGF
ncbi:MAG: hypothetical protein AB8B74_08215 [Crocinitomicaceae bacterium]